MRIKRNLAAGALLGLAVAMTLPAGAQEIAEIVVTARRQGEEKLMETPLAITAFDANAIESKGISNLQDVANLTPGLSFFNPLGENLPTPVIRGVVPQDIFGENAAAIFVDGVYVAGREGLNFSQLDIERIEVLKGPQSSTYGRNAFSGAINYVTKAPSDVFSSKVEAEGGNRGKQKIMGEISGPIFSEALTGRVSAMYDEWDGSYDNSLAPENDIGGYRYRSFQGKLRWRPADSLDITLGLYRSNDEIDEAGVAGLLTNCEDQVEQTQEDVNGGAGERLQNWCGRIPKLKELPGMLDASQFPNGVQVPGSISKDTMPKNALATGEDRNLTRGNLNIAWDTDAGTLTSITGYSNLRQNSISDFNRSSGDTAPFAYCYPSTNENPPACNPPYTWSRVPMGFIDEEFGSTVEEWSQELRFTGPRDQRLRWQVGGYYFHSTLESRSGNPIATRPLPGDIGPGGNIALGPVAAPTWLAIGSYIFATSFTPDGGMDPLNRTLYEDKEKSWSVFGSTDFDITDKLEARFELRYNKDHKKSLAFSYTPCATDGDGDGDYGDGLGDNVALPIGTPDPGCGDDAWDLRVREATGYYYYDGNDNLQFRKGIQDGSARFDNTTGRLGLKYQMDSGWMAYGSIAYGEKPGGLSISPNIDVVDGSGTRPITLTNKFDPEKITAYEVGLKGYTPDRRIRVDIAAFFNDWRNIVLRQLTEVDPATGLHFTQPRGLNVNAGDAHVFGWELTADVGITDSLTGRLTTAYTDSKLLDARQDTYALFPSFYTTDPSCAPSAIQSLPTAEQDARAGECRAMSGDVSGKTNMRQPEWTASVSLDYVHQLFGDWDLKSSISGNYVGKIFTANDNQNWVPAHTNVNFNIGLESPRYTLQFWVRNLFENDEPLSAFRDIYWTNDSDMLAKTPVTGTTIRDASTFEDFPPLRMSISYPSLRTFGLTARVRFGGAEK
ncbi:MAG: TonB-dependent receptor [Gammaproteobacteria bacterium]|nr:TonB-dependent receptor [Gammaproteobacteria bacterium]